MKVKCDDKKILLTKQFIEAIKNLMREEILMFRVREPESRECWVIGVCDIEDLMKSNGIKFTYGGIDEAAHMIKDAFIWVDVPL